MMAQSTRLRIAKNVLQLYKRDLRHSANWDSVYVDKFLGYIAQVQATVNRLEVKESATGPDQPKLF